jgi:hypothetical protein
MACWSAGRGGPVMSTAGTTEYSGIGSRKGRGKTRRSLDLIEACLRKRKTRAS